jgi:DNA-binding NtrC family response regulator
MPSILLVDDSPVALRALAQRLASEGFEVREALSAAAARNLDSATLGRLQCAILDLQLADGDGTDLAASLAGRRPSLPIAFFTAGATPSLVECARGRGPVFLKPDVTPVLQWVKRTLRSSQPPPSLGK